MPTSARTWIVTCRACDIVIGTVEGGHFIHDPACERPLAIGAGVLRCCQCAGRLSREPGPVIQVSDEDEVPVSTVIHWPTLASRREALGQRV